MVPEFQRKCFPVLGKGVLLEVLDFADCLTAERIDSPFVVPVVIEKPDVIHTLPFTVEDSLGRGCEQGGHFGYTLVRGPDRVKHGLYGCPCHQCSVPDHSSHPI